MKLEKYYTDRRGMIIFSGDELEMFEKTNPTLNAIMGYVNKSGILHPHEFAICCKRNPLVSYCGKCPIKYLFGIDYSFRVCVGCTCSISDKITCCAERTYLEMIGRQNKFDYTALSKEERIKRVERVFIPHFSIKVV